MLEFKELHINNFMSIGKISLDFNTNENLFVHIDAENRRKEDQSLSNGSGKSSVFESLVWCLTGDTIRGFKDVVNRYQDNDCSVCVLFEFNEVPWKIERRRTKKGANSLKIWKNGKELEYKGLRDAEEVLGRELPELTAKFLGSTVVMGQGLPQRFTNNSPAGRKAVLEELSNADYMISQVKEKIKTRLETLNKELRETEDAQLKANSEKALMEGLLAKDEAELQKVEAFDIDGETKLLEKIEESGKKLAQKQAVLASEVQALAEVKNKLNDQRVAVLSDFDANIRKEETAGGARIFDVNHSINKQRNESLEKIVEDISIGKEKLSELREKKSHLAATISGGNCSLCGQKLPSSKEEDQIKAAADLESCKLSYNLQEKANAELEKEKNEISARFDDQAKEKIAAIKAELNKKIDIIEKAKKEALEAIVNDLETKSRELAEKENHQSVCFTDLSDLRSQYKLKKVAIETHYEKLRNLKAGIGSKNNTIMSLVKTLESLVTVRETLEERLKVIKSMDNFASRDFRGILLEDIIHNLDMILKEKAARVYGEPLTSFYQEGNAIEIAFDGKEYEALSGGERQKLDILIQLSLRDLIVRTSGIQSNLLVLDEIFDSLDMVGCEAIVGVIMDLNTSVYLVTHRKELNIPFDRKFTVVKEENGIAHLEIGA